MSTRLLFATFAAILALASCGDAGTGVSQHDPEEGEARVEAFAVPGVVRSGWILNTAGRPIEVTYEIQDGRAIWEGDIDLGPVEAISGSAEEAVKRQNSGGAKLGLGIDGLSNRWPDGVVPYTIPAGFPNPERITAAIAHIEANTNNVDFVVATTHQARIEFMESTGCSSHVGRSGGLQYVRLAGTCTTGNTIHELLHVLGMYHEQSRCDRDLFVTINWGNIEPGKSHNFVIQCDIATDYSSYAEASIMHYPPTAFGVGGAVTIASNRGQSSAMGQRNGLHNTDIYTINKMYKYGHDQGGG